MRSWKVLALSAAAMFALPAMSSASILYSEDFPSDVSAGWNINNAPTANASLQSAEFGYDYSSYGIPAAPGSADTKGLRLRANIPGGAASPVAGTRPAGVTSGLSVSPKTLSLTGNYTVSFYAWANFHGSQAGGLGDNAGSPGGTNNLLFAVGTAGNVPLVVGNTGLVTNGVMDAVGFATTGDGGIASDYRVYPASGTISTAASGVYAAGTANDGGGQTPMSNTNVYYQTRFGTHTAPAAEAAIATGEVPADTNIMTGPSQTGSFGFAWHKVELIKNGNIVAWDVDGFRIATVDSTGLPLGGGDIAFGASDVNSTTTSHPALLFSLIDNLQVTDTVPEPASLALISLGAVAVVQRRRRRAC